jgi:tetratricopeptide (TPR) repeat protein
VALASPIVFIAVVELALRGIGFGYPTSFFLRAQHNGRDVLIENQSFARRYFPPGLERTPQTIVMAAAKPADTIRIFVFGESAALGDPDSSYGFSRQLEILLQAATPTQRVEVINVALTAINSHVIRDIARDCAKLQGDYWILYVGHNEVVGPFGAGTVFGGATSSQRAIRLNLALKKTRVGQLLDVLRWRLAPPDSAPDSWRGLEMFLTQQVAGDDPRLSRVYANFADNLREIISCGQRAGARVFVATVAVNLDDCPPFASVHRPGLSASAQREWDRCFELGQAALASTNAGAALPMLRQATAIDDRHAALHFLLGRVQREFGQANEAEQSYATALDLDALRFRADARINHLIREVAAEMKAELVDVARHLKEVSREKNPGREYFYDHVHFNFAGNHEVARLLAQHLRRGWGPERWLSVQECAAALAFTDFDRYRVLDEVRQRLDHPPFTLQWNQDARRARLTRELSALQSGSFTAAKAVYEKAIAARPDDPVLRENFGTLLRDFGQLDEALAQWQRLVALVPHSSEACLGLGDTLDALGRSSEAIGWFRRALALHPESVETRNGLALALAGTGEMDAARREFEMALRQRPSFTEARVNLGHLLAGQGHVGQALQHFREAVRRDTNSAPAFLGLGEVLLQTARLDESIASFRAAVRLKTNDVLARFELGVALAKAGRKTEAVESFKETLRLQPNHPRAAKMIEELR